MLFRDVVPFVLPFQRGSAAVWGSALVGVYVWNRYDEETGSGGMLKRLGIGMGESSSSSSHSNQQSAVFSQTEMEQWNNAKREARGREWEKADHKMRQGQELEKKNWKS
jgi:hypothetical protein